ncbi:uncharacterized protein DUF2637 [Pseudonocardia sediminis]|uniref:Uncharacterized protein DUF2637 n=2 Tax=Pseudonocardia sediminis TaxID=1397368 RepID=A0A4Q7UZU1_PSEST|nr:uncharacterized protein DUF2637 [Pseudonocardia sediminis]
MALVGLLAVVAAAAAVLSFAALRDLARTCGFGAGLAWLLPVVVDAGAAAGSLVWLGERAAPAARRFARALALALLGLSVAANALGHGLAAFALAPPWWVVVVVSAIAPAVLGAVVHLSVLVGRPDPASATTPRSAATVPAAAATDADGPARTDESARAAELIAAGAGRRRLSRELEITEHEARRLLTRARQDANPGGEIAAGRELASTNGHGGAR